MGAFLSSRSCAHQPPQRGACLMQQHSPLNSRSIDVLLFPHRDRLSRRFCSPATAFDSSTASVRWTVSSHLKPLRHLLYVAQLIYEDADKILTTPHKLINSQHRAITIAMREVLSLRFQQYLGILATIFDAIYDRTVRWPEPDGRPMLVLGFAYDSDPVPSSSAALCI